MPYPVSPPALPPVVNAAPSETTYAEAPGFDLAELGSVAAPATHSAASFSALLAAEVSQPEAGTEPPGMPRPVESPVPSLPTADAIDSFSAGRGRSSLLPANGPTAITPVPAEESVEESAEESFLPFTSTIPAAAVPELTGEFSETQEALFQTESPPESLQEPLSPPAASPSPADNPTTNGLPNQPAPAAPVGSANDLDVIELNADRQIYNEQQQVFEAEGNVELRFRQAVLNSDRLFVNIPNRIAVADGNAVLTRGQQVLRGDRIEYNLVQNQGVIQGARGELFLPSITTDTAPVLDPTVVDRPQQDELQVVPGPGGLGFGFDSDGDSDSSSSNQLSQLRYEADEIEFMGEIWEASDVRITNDPFSPPELELRSNRVTVTPLGPGRTEIRARNPRLVFDQGFSLPLLQDRLVIDNRERNPGLFSFGFDEEDRGGFFIERGFDQSIGQIGLLTLTPQIFVQRGIDEGFGNLDSYGLIARLTVNPTPTTLIRGNATFTSFDFEDFEDTFRGSFRVQQLVARHTVALEYSYRDRLFNGSLGFQDVQSSLGLVVTSPTVPLGNSGVNLTYQAGVQRINSNANSDRLSEPDIRDLLDFNEDGTRDNSRIDLTRYQASAALSRFFPLWTGTALPATPDQGLRYTPSPIVPSLGLSLGARGTFSAYSNGDTQSVLTGSIGLSGQFGNFSRPFLDFTGFSISYSYNAIDGETPFNFDRVNDIQILSVGLTQQIYGPFRFGVRSTLYLESDSNRDNDADTTFTLEYSRRTYSINLSYSPQRESGAIGFRINDFNWVGDPGPLSTGLGASNELGGLRLPD
jgi:hypothetical protein